MSSAIDALPNPSTPMAFLPPDLAWQVTVANYVLVGALSTLIWDILTNLNSDYRMLTQYRVNISSVVYVVSRLSCLAYLLGLVISETAPVGHCNSIHLIQSIYPIAIPSTSLLFFFRVRAMFERSKIITVFFFISWLAVVGGSLTPVQGLSGANIGSTKFCLITRMENYVFAAGMIPFINDTLVFCATTWALMQNSYAAERNLSNGVKTVVFGQYLPAFSRAVLQDGQAYYLTIISLNLVTAILFYNKGVPIVYRSFVGVPNIVLMNNMACYVYRNVRFGVFMENTMGPMNTSTFSGQDRGTPGHSTGIVFGTASSIRFSSGMRGDKPALDVVGLQLHELDDSAENSSRREEKIISV